MNRKKLVVCVDGVCTKDGKFLLLKRSVEPFKGKWHVPGGHVEDNEPLKEALKREFKEETNLTINVGDIIAYRTEETADQTKIIIAFQVTPLTTQIQLNSEHDAHGWFTQFPEDCVYNYQKHLQPL
ncbi:MAG: NUDIX hydrolase [Candidatus Bathyarchaeia archaeon]